jgi:hypothetical protein
VTKAMEYVPGTYVLIALQKCLTKPRKTGIKQ